jgi:plasmid maintenance system antidote protein VapI
MALENPDSAPTGKAQAFLPFAETELLAVRLRPAEFARCIGVTKQSVSRWIKNNTVTLGADGRLNPTAAMRQLLRTGDPGRIRARLVRQAFADMGDLRAQAARADELGLKVAALAEQIEVERFTADQDYETLGRWLDEFKRCIAETPPAIRAEPDADAWRLYVNETLTRVMEADSLDDLNEIDAQVAAALADEDSFTVRSPLMEGGGNIK